MKTKIRIPLVATIVFNFEDTIADPSPTPYQVVTDFTMTVKDGATGVTIGDGPAQNGVISLKAPRGTPFQLNFVLGDSVPYRLIGVSLVRTAMYLEDPAGGGRFVAKPWAASGAQAGMEAVEEFPATLGVAGTTLVGTLHLPNVIIPYGVEPNTMALIDANLWREERQCYTFHLLMEDAQGTVGVIDPYIVNDAED